MVGGEGETEAGIDGDAKVEAAVEIVTIGGVGMIGAEVGIATVTVTVTVTVIVIVIVTVIATEAATKPATEIGIGAATEEIVKEGEVALVAVGEKTEGVTVEGADHAVAAVRIVNEGEVAAVAVAVEEIPVGGERSREIDVATVRMKIIAIRGHLETLRKDLVQPVKERDAADLVAVLVNGDLTLDLENWGNNG